VAGRALLALTTHYETQLHTLTLRYEARVAALQQQVHLLEAHHGGVVWDEEVHFGTAHATFTSRTADDTRSTRAEGSATQPTTIQQTGTCMCGNT